MSESTPNIALIRRLEQRLAEVGVQADIEQSDGALILSGVVSSEEARQAAEDIAAQVVPDARIDNQLEIESILPTDVDAFAGQEPTAELAESISEIEASGGDIEPDFTDRPGFNDPIGAAGPQGSEEEDLAESGDVYTPPIDPVLTTDAHGQPRVLGGFEIDSAEDADVEASAEDRKPGDEALADAIRRELAEDSATSDLNVYVVVRNGVAHLRGAVPDLDDADNVEAVAARVPGVRDVVEELDVTNV